MLLRPVLAVYLPAGQRVQLLLPAFALYWLRGQAEHVFFMWCGLYLPAAHALQELPDW